MKLISWVVQWYTSTGSYDISITSFDMDLRVKVLVPALLLLAGVGAAEDDSVFFRSTLPPAQKSYKILFLTPTKIKTHIIAQQPLMIALANRGHKVVVLSDASWTDRHPNVTYLDHGATDLPVSTDYATFSAVLNPLYLVTSLCHAMGVWATKLFDDPVVQSLFRTRKEFNMIIVDEILFYAVYPFVHETTYGKLSLSPLHHYMGATYGNPLNPAFVSSSVEEHPQPYSTWHRFKNCINSMKHYISFRYIIPYRSTTELTSRFPSVPPPHVIEKNASFLLTCGDHNVDGVYPALPHLVSVAGITLQPAKTLPQDISQFLSGSTPAILVTMGTSFGHTSQIPQVYKDIFNSVFSQLPYKVLLRFDQPPSQNYPNIFARKWFPQQDVLAHPNVRACISHGGVQTVHESIHHGVPILGLPYMPEHRRMIQGLVYGGQGLMLEWSELSVQTLNESIMEIMKNPSYATKMAQKSRIFNDQRESPLDRAVYWIEYVAKYQGAPHLQSPARHLTWIEILNLDIIALFFFILYLLFRLQMWCLRKFFTWFQK